MQQLKERILLCCFVVIFSLLTINSDAQKMGSDYDAGWKSIDQLINKGLTKSALEEVNSIYIKAKKEGNNVQVIKSLLYQLSLNQNIEEDADVKSIVNIEKEIASATEPGKSILYSISAEMYQNYFQQNRYSLYNKTNTTNFKKDDIKTWTIADFHKRISDLYFESIKEEKLLQQKKLEPFDAIIIKGTARYLRPTLYDLLTHRALEYFKNDEADITKPAYAFELKDEKAFSPVNGFVSHKFINKDSASLHYKALVIFQKILAFHANDEKADALIDADIERIEFANEYGVMNNKDELYINALQNLSSAYNNNPASAQAEYLTALEIYNKATTIEKMMVIR